MKHALRRRLGKIISARGHMSWILTATIFSGILFSKFLLWMGMPHPIFRYSLSVIFSYGMFYLLVYLWLRSTFGRKKKSADGPVDHALDAIDIADMGRHLPNSKPSWSGGGGGFSGGGASGSWDSEVSNALPAMAAISSPNSSSTSSSLGGALDVVADGDDGLAILLLLGLVAAIFGGGIYLIVYAPEILFEAAFEVMLASGLLKKTKEIDRNGWAVPIFFRGLLFHSRSFFPLLWDLAST